MASGEAGRCLSPGALPGTVLLSGRWCPGPGALVPGEPGRGSEREGEGRPRVLSHRHPLPGAVAVPRVPAAPGIPAGSGQAPPGAGCAAQAPCLPVLWCGRWLLVAAYRWGKPRIRAVRVTCCVLRRRALGMGFPLAARLSVQPSLTLTLFAWLLARVNTKRVVN